MYIQINEKNLYTRPMPAQPHATQGEPGAGLRKGLRLGYCCLRPPLRCLSRPPYLPGSRDWRDWSSSTRRTPGTSGFRCIELPALRTTSASAGRCPACEVPKGSLQKPLRVLQRYMSLPRLTRSGSIPCLLPQLYQVLHPSAKGLGAAELIKTAAQRMTPQSPPGVLSHVQPQQLREPSCCTAKSPREPSRGMGEDFRPN